VSRTASFCLFLCVYLLNFENFGPLTLKHTVVVILRLVITLKTAS
jgi:hypothetical protein